MLLTPSHSIVRRSTPEFCYFQCCFVLADNAAKLTASLQQLLQSSRRVSYTLFFIIVFFSKNHFASAKFGCSRAIVPVIITFRSKVCTDQPISRYQPLPAFLVTLADVSFCHKQHKCNMHILRHFFMCHDCLYFMDIWRLGQPEPRLRRMN